jgi:RteC protein
MLPEYQEYYQELLAAFRSHEDALSAPMGVIEACFKSSLDYWGRVCKLVRAEGFGGEKDEISFFKEVKPAFAAFIEYYTYRYHALLFAPVNNPSDLGRFWRREEKKMQRFYETNHEFCSYMRENATHRDAEYFLRASLPPDTERVSDDLIHDGDSGLLSPKDPLVTIMKAYELYGQYIETIVAPLNPF